MQKDSRDLRPARDLRAAHDLMEPSYGLAKATRQRALYSRGY